MTVDGRLAHGDFTALAADYSLYRPGYAPAVRAAILGLLQRPPLQLDAADVGAGTGIWTRMLADCGFRSLSAVEPNEEMRRLGIRDSAGHEISWRAGSGEATGLDTESVDLVTAASCFHWIDFDRGTAEVCRILRSGGWFVALWNPRLVELNTLLADIEAEIARLKPDFKRVASGRSEFTASLSERLWSHAGFDDVVMVEGRQVSIQSVEHHLGAWRSVNDVRVQLGEEKFGRFLAYAQRRLAAVDRVETTYATRAWAARRR